MGDRLKMMADSLRNQKRDGMTHSGTFDNDAARSRAWQEIKSAPGQLAQGVFTGLAGAPVEIANMALRPIGLGSDRPVGGMASLASLIRADEGSVPYQAGTMLPIGPEGLAMGAKAFLPAMAAALGGTAIASKASKGAKLSGLARALAKERGVLNNPEIVRYGDGQAMSLPAKTEFELAHEVAQRNAALPIEQGGLGLPPNNTAMQRAEAMGFDTPAYHGGRGDINNFNDEFLGLSTGAESANKAHFFASNPNNANIYSDIGMSADVRNLEKKILIIKKELEPERKYLFNDVGIKKNQLTGEYKFPDSTSGNDMARFKKYLSDFEEIKKLNQQIGSIGESGGNVTPVLINTKGFGEKDYLGSPYRDVTYSDSLSDKSDGFLFKNTHDPLPDEKIIAVKNPSNIRSRFAAFDPMQRNSANILAGGAAGAVGLPALFGLGADEYQ